MECHQRVTPTSRAPIGLVEFELANGASSFNQSGKEEICKHLIKADLMECMVALLGNLF